MQDSFGRTIDYLRISVTDRCNLRCRYCMPDEGVTALQHGDVLSYEEMLRIARAALSLGVRKIRITGGEPLVRRGIVDFVERLRALSPVLELVLTTNGLLLGAMAQALKSAGLDRVNVSLDTLRPERFLAITRRDGLNAVLDGLAAAEAAGLTPLKLNMVPIVGVNDDEIGDFARLSRDRDWDVRFIEYMPVSSNLSYGPELRLPADAIQAALEAVGPLTPLPAPLSAGPAHLWRIDNFAGRVGVIPAVSRHFCAGCNRLRVTADGRIRPCLFGDNEIDLRTPLRAGASDEAIAALLGAASADKPAGHRIGSDDFSHASRAMHGIGG